MALSESERMIFELSARINSFEKAMLDAAGSADRAAARIEKRFEAQNRKVTQQFNNFSNGIRTTLATIGIGLIARDVVELGDTWTTVGNRLAFAGVQTERLATVQQTVADIASRTRADLDATADLFARMYRSSQDLGASLQDVARVTEIVNKALAGASQSERQSAIRQLGQGLGSGRLQGDELRSILENSRPIAEAIAREFNTTVGNLRKLGQEGQLEARRVFHAIEAAGADIDEAFTRTTFTVADAFTKLRTEAARFVGTNAQTSQAVRGLARLIDFVANNFEALASATVIAATVLGGAFAGQAVARAVTALLSLTATANTAKAALAFFGGPLGIGLTLVGGALAYVATQTDLLTSSTEVLARASNSSYSALQQIASLAERMQALADAGENAADQTGEIARSGREATQALNRLSESSDAASGRLRTQATISSALIEIERARTRETINQAIADERAGQAALRRESISRSILAGQRVQNAGSGRAQGQLTREEQAQIDASEQLVDLYQRALRAEASLSAETRAALYGTENTTGGIRDNTQATAAAQRVTREEMQRAHEITLAQLTHNAARLRQLQDEQAIQERTQRYEKAGLALAAARAQAEREVRAEREATNAEAERTYSISLLQDQIDLSRVRNQQDIVDELSDQVEILRRARELVDQRAISEEEAVAQASEFVQEMRAAINEDRAHQLETRDLEQQLEQARARGDERAERVIQRRLDLEREIAELRRMGLSEEAATERARHELAALEQADMQGKFRDWFRGGVHAALEGDFGDYFQNWIRERAAKGLDAALDQVADALFEAVQPVWRRIVQAGGENIANALGRAIGGSGSDQVKAMSDAANAAAGALQTVLGGAASEAAGKIAAQGVEAAISSAKDQAATTLRVSSAAKLIAAEVALTNAAAAAAAQLYAMAAAPSGGKKGGFASFLGDLLGSLGGGGGGVGGASHGFGGFRAGGGPMEPGRWYVTGERGPEIIAPRVPSFAIPQGMGGGATYVDRRTTVYNFVGTQKEFDEFRKLAAAKEQSQYAETLAIVGQGLDRRQWGRS